MKKLLYSVAIVAACAFASCGSKEAKATEEVPATENTEVVDTTACTNEECKNDSTKCCTEGEACVNEECKNDSTCTAAACQTEEAKAE
ncbi:MAG: hypothetical protein HDS75_04375 [Bacteroidales bacterium]|nr:hypothetical protein [Bacteroidales bacterium]MDE6831786.1 hypothetical protein [Muribaculaceae bacterium]